MLKSNVSRNIALVGQPNSGKTTLYNLLTDSNQQIGNWPGVTVEKKQGRYLDAKNQLTVNVVDLPGCYSLIATAEMPLDEKITCEFIATSTYDIPNTIYVNVVDASNLSRDLYLSLQLLELGLPVIIALNCIDLATTAGIKIDTQALSKTLGCPVVPIIAKTGENVRGLQQEIALIAVNTYQPDYPELLRTTINFWHPHVSPGQAIHALEGDIFTANKLTNAGINSQQVADQIAKQISMPLDLLIAKHRRSLVNKILQQHVTKQKQKMINLSAKIDSVVLHKFYGPVAFTAVMYLMFTLAINVGGMLQLVFDQVSESIFVTGVNNLLINAGLPNWLIDILANGVGRGINITVTFVPVLSAMFLCLGILESSGYMMRAAFLVDRLMRLLGLPGKSFVSMIVGFGCNVPAIMGARSLASKRERTLTIMMTPFMSCSARLAIYAIFVAAFFPVGGQNIIFSLYIIGILVAVLTGFALRTTILPSERSLSLMEMPNYRWPTAKALLIQVWHRTKTFIVKAGGLIIILSIILNGVGDSVIQTVGKQLTPIFAPIGITADNWPATVGLVTGLLAKEAVIGTLDSVYKQAGTDLITGFGGAAAAYAYLLFTLLYFPCISVVATIAKELNKKWAAFSVVWSTGLAYIIAALFYQIATWSRVLSAESVWIVSLFLTLLGLFITARLFVTREHGRMTVRYKALPTPVSLV